MVPLPTEFSGWLCVANMHATGDDHVALLTYDAFEHEAVFGQPLRTRYHVTDTYVKRDSVWRLLASQTSVLPSEHEAVKTDELDLRAYVGTYALDSSFVYTVTTEGAHLRGQRGKHAAQELFPLGGDRFFVRGAPRGVKIFHRSATGRVDALIDRRDNNDLVWRKVQ